MYQDWYERISAPFRNEVGEQSLWVIDKALVVAVAAGYVFSLVFLAVTLDVRFFRMLIVPALVFGVVTILRERLDYPRPYELYDIDPLIVKNTRGKSLPSRHVASAWIIACALMWLHLDWGIVALFAALLVSGTRIVGGVHFPSDVAAAIGISLAFALVGFVLIP